MFYCVCVLCVHGTIVNCYLNFGLTNYCTFCMDVLVVLNILFHFTLQLIVQNTDATLQLSLDNSYRCINNVHSCNYTLTLCIHTNVKQPSQFMSLKLVTISLWDFSFSKNLFTDVF